MKVYKFIARLKNNVVQLEKIVLSDKDLPVGEKFVAGENYPINIYQDLQTITGEDYQWFMENHTMFYFAEIEYATLKAPVVENRVYKQTVIVEVSELRLPGDLYDNLADHLEISNGSAHQWNKDNDCFKQTDEFNAILEAHNVPMDAKIYLHFSW